MAHGQEHPLAQARKTLSEAEAARREGQLPRAQKLCEQLLAEYPDYVAALHTLGLVHADREDHRRALPYLVQASLLNPQDWSILTVLAGTYLRLGSGTTALRTIEQARALNRGDANVLAALGEINREEREYEAGAAAFREALDADDTLHAARYALGQCCVELGADAEAAAAWERMVDDGRLSAPLIYSLSQVPPAHLTKDILALAEQAAKANAKPDDDFRSLLGFARAAAHHNAGRHEDAWRELSAANLHMRRRTKNTRDRQAQIEQQALESVRKYSRQGALPREDEGLMSLFILGISRSGKTTLENLLGGHRQVKRGYESPIVENAVRQTFQVSALPTRERLLELPPALDDTFRRTYEEALERRAGDARVFTNTHPTHINSALRLAHVLPRARFVFVKRNIDDATLRIFMKRYHVHNEYAYAVATVREHIVWYDAMIDAITPHLDDRAILIDYEDMVADPAAVRGAMAGLVGLDVTDLPAPVASDDRGCARPYRDLMAAAISG